MIKLLARPLLTYFRWALVSFFILKGGIRKWIFHSRIFTALISIILIDLVLAGDNAVVIALASRNLPKHLQKERLYGGQLGQSSFELLRRSSLFGY